VVSFAAQRAAEYAIHDRPCVVNLETPRGTLDSPLERNGAWAACGVDVHYLPAYSPELNAIETLWSKIKYEWLPSDCYASNQTMKSASWTAWAPNAKFVLCD